MISADGILDKLRAWAETDAGKQKTKDALQSISSNGKKLSNGQKIPTQEEMSRMARDLTRMIQKRIPEELAKSRVSPPSLSYSSPTQNADGSFSIALTFDPASVHRDSLYEDGYPDGVDNIVALFNCGWHAKDYAYGYWGVDMGRNVGTMYYNVRSRKDREPLYFMQDAVNEFNSKYSKKYNVFVTLSNKYEQH